MLMPTTGLGAGMSHHRHRWPTVQPVANDVTFCSTAEMAEGPA
jgi:hypothetical protein